jgi:hypothetical protein
LGTLDSEEKRGLIQLKCHGPITGSWRLTIHETDNSQSASELILAFLDRAIEYQAREVGEVSGWEPQVEVIASEGTEPIRRSTSDGTGASPSSSFLDLIEAVYAGGASGWAASDLVPLVERGVGQDGPRVWDVIRALCEGGWLKQATATRWKATRWFLCRPRILVLSSSVALLEGAACETLRDRFVAKAIQHGGAAAQHGGIGPWSVPMFSASGADPSQLATELGLPIQNAIFDKLAPAPSCWAHCVHGVVGRKLSAIWNWRSGRFSVAADQDPVRVRLERWSRPNGDAQDVYRVVSSDGSETLLESRHIAIIEAHRLAGRPLFQHNDARLTRIAGDGHLPEASARALRLQHLQAPGLVEDSQGRLVYAYPCSFKDARQLENTYGAAIGVISDERPMDYALVRRLGPRGRALLNPNLPPAYHVLTSLKR